MNQQPIEISEEAREAAARINEDQLQGFNSIPCQTAIQLAINSATEKLTTENERLERELSAAKAEAEYRKRKSEIFRQQLSAAVREMAEVRSESAGAIKNAHLKIDDLTTQNQQLREELKQHEEWKAQPSFPPAERAELQTTILGLREQLKSAQLSVCSEYCGVGHNWRCEQITKALSTLPADFAKQYCKRSVLNEFLEGILTCLKYPRGSEAQVRCLEEVGQDARDARKKLEK